MKMTSIIFKNPCHISKIMTFQTSALYSCISVDRNGYSFNPPLSPPPPSTIPFSPPIFSLSITQLFITLRTLLRNAE